MWKQIDGYEKDYVVNMKVRYFGFDFKKVPEKKAIKNQNKEGKKMDDEVCDISEYNNYRV